MDHPSFGSVFWGLDGEPEERQSEIRRLLGLWDLSHLAGTFEANNITVAGLKLLTQDEIKELIPRIGDRGIFRSSLAAWLRTIDNAELVTASNDSQGEGNLITLQSVEEQQNRAGPSHMVAGPSSATFTSPTTSNISQSPTASVSDSPSTSGFFTKNNKLPRDYVKKILLASVEGKEVLQRNETRGRLTNVSEKKLISRIIISHILAENPEASLGHVDFAALALQIPSVLPHESSSAYFSTQLRENSSKTRFLKVNVGHLVDSYTQKVRVLVRDNLRRKRSRSTPTPSERSRSPVEPRPLNLQEFEELNTNEALVWLNSGTDPWTTVVAKWKETSANRMGIITSTDSPYL
ncbi:hypothetical protein M8J76_000729 [Diaphorina citri]|nr:hypothetical protein M8J76_002972 [Diaphorina citri]KAI5727069.1 hypothetical protein M8J76_013623 [Diaphorina citri]KAI5748627.1 hypothetical protein M8J76_000729 [Diaphorina citri]